MFKIINKSTTTQHKHAGFTLAETLITLVVIGIVAALTVPTLINNHKKEFVETRLKATYSIFANMFKAAEADYGTFGTWDMSELGGQRELSSGREILDPFVNKYVLPYLKIADDKWETFQDFGYEKILEPDGSTFKSGTSSNRFITLLNGTTFWFGWSGRTLDNGKNITYYLRMFVDVDGPKKGPNTLAKDIFVFYQPFVKDFPLSMYGEHANVTCNYWGNLSAEYIQNYIQEHKCTFMVNKETGALTYTNFKQSRETILEHCRLGNDGAQWGPSECGALIRMDGWRIADDYPWL